MSILSISLALKLFFITKFNDLWVFTSSCGGLYWSPPLVLNLGDELLLTLSFMLVLKVF